MTKQDYIALAEAFIEARNLTPANWDGASLRAADYTLGNVAERVADVLARDNSRFDRERFLAAALKGEWSNALGHRNGRAK